MRSKICSLDSIVIAFVILLFFLGEAQAARVGMDTGANVTDLPFSVNGTQVMDLTTGGLSISGSVTASNGTFNGFVQATTNSAASAIVGISGASGAAVYGNNTGGAGWAGVFTGQQYGVYGVGSALAGLFNGPMVVNGPSYLNSNVQISGTVSSSNNAYAPNFSGSSPDGRPAFSGVDNANGWTGVFNGNLYGVYASGANWAGIFAGPLLATGIAYLQSEVNISGQTNIDSNLNVAGTVSAGSVTVGGRTYYANGGSYQTHNCKPTCRIPNPVTGGCNCPSGYSPYQVNDFACGTLPGAYEGQGMVMYQCY